jgi:ABC-type branched-subunit amino acid transport system substrate-binding protein
VWDLNERGGVLGQSLAAVVVDDFCDPDQALAAARKLVAEGVPVVVGVLGRRASGLLNLRRRGHHFHLPRGDQPTAD